MSDSCSHRTSARWPLVALIACCAIPMTLVLALTSITALTVDRAAALVVGLVAASTCIVVMVARRRSTSSDGTGTPLHG